MTDLRVLIDQWQESFESVLAEALNHTRGAPGPLQEAMRYSALSGGKRMRPLLVYASGRALGLSTRQLQGIASAIEIIHAYSLIHDDLPAMDDDDLRRGRPTCHKAFDEATAILAGDALQALAFEILAEDRALSEHPKRQIQVISHVARACGASGMAGGQALDLAAVGSTLPLAELEAMHNLKTGALIAVSAAAPALLAGAPPELFGRLQRFGKRVGLAFQIHDDILDVTGDSETTGKSTQKDAALHKPTFPAVIGLEESRAHAARLRDEALAEIRQFPGNCDCLTWLAGYAIARDS
jgi:farnesyl diphosphate synthase